MSHLYFQLNNINIGELVYELKTVNGEIEKFIV